VRLTLRTLLAYLDDILEPNQAKEIGTKVSQSTFATGLTNRIREVMRRRRLTAPDTDGPDSGVDPNTVAEYLDNTLPTEAVADVEKVFLESDVNLAEVAASHQVLTLVLGEPVDIPQECRERMYVLGPVAADDSVTPEEALDESPSPQHVKGEDALRNGNSQVAGGVVESVIPAYLRPKPMWRRAMPYTIAGVVAIVWFGLIVYDPTFNIFSSSPDGSGSNEPDHNGQFVAANGGDDGGLPPIDIGKQGGGGDVPKKPKVDPVAKDEGLNPKPPADKPGPAGKKLVVNVEKPPTPMPTEKGKEPVVVVEADDPSKKKVPDVPVASGPTVRYVSTKGILLSYDKASDDWFVLPEKSVVPKGVRIAIPHPFTAEFEVGVNQCRVRIAGGTALRFLPPQGKAAVSLEIEQGRVLLHGDGEADDPLLIGIGTTGESWQLALTDANTTCGVEIVPHQPIRIEQKMGANWYTGGVYVASGSAHFADGKGLLQALALREQITLTPEYRAALVDPASTVQPPTAGFPGWLDPLIKKSRSESPQQKSFAKEFDPRQPLSDNIPPVVKSDFPKLSESAVQCLALTGDHAELVRALRNPDHEESRVAAIVGLRTWLAMAPERGPQLKKDLESVFPSAQEIETVYQLLWGYGPQDAKDPRKSKRLVDWLEHERVAVRQLAFFHIQKLTGQDHDYLPHNLPAQRFAAIRRWRRQLERNGALVKP
jgi:hypothetical protein